MTDLSALTAHTARASGLRLAWPAPPADSAYRGLAGEFVRLIEPRTEADPAALLLNFLVLAGCAIGRTAHMRVGAAVHYANLYAVVVGGSGAAGRKGTAHTEAAQVFAKLDSGIGGKTAQGVVSGEGIIWAVRDPVFKIERDKTGEYNEVLVDDGIDDKRLLLREGEFAQVLRVGARDNNITSVTLRAAWDNGSVLQTLAKNSPATATGAHLSMIGDITPAELLRELSATDKANGFANRILWCCSLRSKELPEPEQVDDESLQQLVEAVNEALGATHTMGPMVRDEGARELWADVYGQLTSERPGMLGSLLARAEAQVVRLSLIYAVLDGYHTIRREHLESALAVWDYCERSAGFLFGNALGDQTADQLAAALRDTPNGMTRAEIHDHFGGHKKSAEITRALGALERAGLVGSVSEETGGRPLTRWFEVRNKRDKRGNGSVKGAGEGAHPATLLAPGSL